jgi:hypothetical protein
MTDTADINIKKMREEEVVDEINIPPSSIPNFYGKREMYGNRNNPNPQGQKRLIRFRPDYPIIIKKLKNGVEEITGTTGYLVVEYTTVLYDRQGKFLDPNDPKRVSYSMWTDSTIRGECGDPGIAILVD